MITPHHDAIETDSRVWRLSPQAAWALLLTPVAGLLVLAVVRLHEPAFSFLLDEDGPVEWLQFVAYLIVVPLALLLVRHLARRDEKLPAVLYALLALACLLIAGEEISWGQRIFGIDTPETLAELNRQEELGLHNVSSAESVLRVALLLAGLYGSLGALLIRRRSGAATQEWVYLFVPPLVFFTCFAILAAHRFVRIVAGEDLGYTFTKLGEWCEFTFAGAVAGFVALNLRRLSTTAVRASPEEDQRRTPA